MQIHDLKCISCYRDRGWEQLVQCRFKRFRREAGRDNMLKYSLSEHSSGFVATLSRFCIWIWGFCVLARGKHAGMRELMSRVACWPGIHISDTDNSLVQSESSHKENWEHRVHVAPATKNTPQLLHYIWPAAYYFVAEPHAAVVGVCLSSHIVGRDRAEASAERHPGFFSVLLLKQTLTAFCQISRHVSAVISTLKSFPCICLVACVITQVVAISTDSNILKSNGCLCVFARRRMANKAQLGF